MASNRHNANGGIWGAIGEHGSAIDLWGHSDHSASWDNGETKDGGGSGIDLDSDIRRDIQRVAMGGVPGGGIYDSGWGIWGKLLLNHWGTWDARADREHIPGGMLMAVDEGSL